MVSSSDSESEVTIVGEKTQEATIETNKRKLEAIEVVGDGSLHNNPQKKKPTFMTNFFLARSAKMKATASDEPCFQELLSLHDKGTNVVVPNAGYDEKVNALEKEKKKLLKDINNISVDALDQEITELYTEAETVKDKLEKLKKEGKQNYSQWKRINETSMKAREVHDYHLSQSNFILASPFRKVIIAGEEVIRTALANQKEHDHSSTTSLPSTVANSENSNNVAAATSTNNVAVNAMDKCLVLTSGNEVELDMVFNKGVKHNSARISRHVGSKKPSIDSQSSSISQSTKVKLVEKQTSSKTTFLATIDKYKLQDDAFDWKANNIICRCCPSVPIIHQARKMKRHADGKKHIEYLQKWKVNKITQQKYEASIKKDYKDNNVELRLTAENVVYRLGAVRQVAAANISFDAFAEMSSWIDQYTKDGYSLGNVRDLSRQHSTRLLDIMIDECRRFLHNDCFKEYSIIFDGTPTFAKCEAIMIRVVTRQYHIYQLVVKVSIFEKNLKHEELANHLLTTLQLRLGLDLKDWVASMQDRAATNKAALN